MIQFWGPKCLQEGDWRSFSLCQHRYQTPHSTPPRSHWVCSCSAGWEVTCAVDSAEAACSSFFSATAVTVSFQTAISVIQSSLVWLRKGLRTTHLEGASIWNSKSEHLDFRHFLFDWLNLFYKLQMQLQSLIPLSYCYWPPRNSLATHFSWNNQSASF